MTVAAEQYLGRFTLHRLQGSSSFATLYQATDARGDRSVALKLFSHNFPEDALAKSGFMELNRKLAALNHPNILHVLESGQDDAGWAITAWMPAASLKDRPVKPMTPAAVAEVLEQAGAALDAAHAIGILHGDLKPANLLVDATGKYRVADFGTAAMAALAPPIVRLYGNTPAPTYLSPEQASEMSMTPRSDIYSLGVLAYQLLTGSVPYTGTDAATVAGKQAKAPPDDPREYNEELSPAVSACILTALARNPDNRYATAGAFATAYREALAHPVAAQVIVPDSAQTMKAAEARLCWSCGHKNPPGLKRCESCWLLLGRKERLPDEELLARQHNPSVGEKSRTGVVATMALVTVFAIAAILPNATAARPVSSVASVSAPGEWTSYQADARNSGFVPGPAPSLKGEIKWQVPIPAGVLAPPVITKDGVYLGTGDARVIAMDPATGKTQWERSVRGPVNATPAVAGDLLYVGLRDGSLLALDRKTGKERWSVATGGSIYGGMKVANGAVYVGNGNGYILALDAQTGKQLWRYESEGWISAIPAITDNGLVVVGSEDGNVYVLDAVTGKLKLKTRVIFSVDSSAAVAGEVAYIGRDQGALMAIDLKQTTRFWDDFTYWSKLQFFVFGMSAEPPTRRGLLWRIAPGGGNVSSPALAGNTAYFVTQSGKRRGSAGGLHAIDLTTRTETWFFPASGSQTPTIVGDTVYLSSATGKVDALTASTGKLQWEWTLPGGLRPSTSPSVAGQTMYVGATLPEPLMYMDRRDGAGKLLKDQTPDAEGHWYFHFGGSYCSAETSPAGPYASQRDALSGGYSAEQPCGVFFAVQ